MLLYLLAFVTFLTPKIGDYSSSIADKLYSNTEHNNAECLFTCILKGRQHNGKSYFDIIKIGQSLQYAIKIQNYVTTHQCPYKVMFVSGAFTNDWNV